MERGEVSMPPPAENGIVLTDTVGRNCVVLFGLQRSKAFVSTFQSVYPAGQQRCCLSTSGRRVLRSPTF